MRILARIVIGILAFCTVILIGLVLLLNTESGRLWVAHQSLQLVENAGLEIHVQDLRSAGLGQWTLANLRLSRQQTTLVEITQLELSWKPSALLHKELHVARLSAQAIDYHQQQRAKDKPKSASWPQLPTSALKVVIDALTVDALTVHGVTLPKEQSLPSYKVSGSASAFTARAPLFLELDIESRTNPADGLTIKTQVSEASSVRINGHLQEAPGGLVGTLARMPSTQAMDVNFVIHVQKQQEQLELVIKELQLPFMGHQFGARGTLRYNLEQRELAIKQLVVHSDKRRHRLEGVINQDDLWLEAHLKRFPLDIASPWVDDLTTGDISGYLRINWLHRQQKTLPNIETKSEINLVYRDQTISAKLNGNLLDGLIDFSPSQLRVQQAQLDVVGQLDLREARSDLKGELLRFNSDLLQPWRLTLPKDLAFQTDRAELTLTGSLKKPRIGIKSHILGQYQQKAFDLNVDGSGNADEAQLKRLTLLVEDSKLNAQGLLDWRSSKTDLHVQFDNIQHHLLAMLPKSPHEHFPPKLTFTAKGHGRIQGNLRKPKVETDSTVIGVYPVGKKRLPFALHADGSIQLGKAANLDMKINQLSLDLADQPTVRISGQYQAKTMAMRVQLQRLPTQVLDALGWNLLQDEGEAEADLNLSGSLAKPMLSGFAELRSAKNPLVEPKELAVPYLLRAEFSHQDDELHAQLRLRYGDKDVGDLRAWMPIASFLQATGPWKSRPLNLQAKGSTNLNVSTLFLDPVVHYLRGTLTADMTVKGTLDKPDFRGQLELTQGYYRNAIYDTILRDMVLMLEGEGDRISITKARARSGKQGFVEFDGSLYWSESRRQANDAVNLSLRAKRFVLIDTNELYAQVAGEGSLTGSFDELTLKGQFEVSPLRTSIDAAIKTPIPEIEVREIDIDATQNKTPELAQKMPTIHLQLVIEAGQQAFLRGRGLDTELGGKVTITGTAANPEFVGRFETLRGRLDIFGKRFVLDDGEVRFTNNAASLNIPAIYTTDDIQIRALLSGSADKPKLTLSSLPSLPQDELVSRLIFGKSVQEITPYEALRLAAAINTLSSGGGFDPMDSARKILNVDSFTLDNERTEEGSGLTVGVGKYVNEKVYIELKSSRNPAQPWQGNVQIELNSNFTLESGTSENSGGNARLMWKRDY